MALTPAERKERLPHGGATKIADATKADLSYVSRAVAGEIFPKSKRTKLKLRRFMKAFARQIGSTVEEAFAPDELARADWPIAAANSVT